MSLEQAFRAHHGDMTNVPTPQERGVILMKWRGAIDRDAHDYSDLVLSHPQRQGIMELEVEAIMQAYLAGFMAGRGWIEKLEAQHAAFLLGRGLRDRVRALGVSFNNLRATLGTSIDHALSEIIEFGYQSGAGKSEESSSP